MTKKTVQEDRDIKAELKIEKNDSLSIDQMIQQEIEKAARQDALEAKEDFKKECEASDDSEGGPLDFDQRREQSATMKAPAICRNRVPDT